MSRRTKEEGLSLALQYRRSCMTQTEFAKSQCMTLTSLRYWIQKSRQVDREAEPSQKHFVEIKAAGLEPSFCGRLWIHTPKAALLFEQLPQVHYLIQLVNGIHAE